jgi:hypothetical protein
VFDPLILITIQKEMIASFGNQLFKTIAKKLSSFFFSQNIQILFYLYEMMASFATRNSKPIPSNNSKPSPTSNNKSKSNKEKK